VLGHLNDQVTAEKLVAQVREDVAEPAPAVTRAEGFVLGYAARSVAVGREGLADAWRRVERALPSWK
jgi:hypothetical protein